MFTLGQISNYMPLRFYIALQKADVSKINDDEDDDDDKNDDNDDDDGDDVKERDCNCKW